MLILRNPQQLQQVAQADIHRLLKQRFHALCDPEPYNPDRHGYFILVETGDTGQVIEAVSGCPLLHDVFNDSQYGDDDFEVIEDHGGFYEVVYVLTDAGFTVVLIIPKATGVDTTVLKLCAEFAATD